MDKNICKKERLCWKVVDMWLTGKGQKISAASNSAKPRYHWLKMVGDRRIELLTSSVSRKRSTSELTAQQADILQTEGPSVNTFFATTRENFFAASTRGRRGGLGGIII